MIQEHLAIVLLGTRLRRIAQRLPVDLLRLLFIYVSLFPLNTTYAEGTNFSEPIVVLSDTTPSYQRVMHGFNQDYGRKLDYFTPRNIPSSQRSQHYITVGARAFKALLPKLRKQDSVRAIFIPKLSYESLVQAYLNTTPDPSPHICALFIEQPIARQLKLARLLLPEARTLGVAVSPSSVSLLDELVMHGQSSNFNITHTLLTHEDNPIRKLRPSISNTDVFLTLPDKAILTRTTAKWILYITLRQRVPLIGFSKQFVDAGALASVYSTPEQIGKFASELTQEQTCHGNNQHPKYFSIGTNPTTARTLMIKLPEVQHLQQELEADNG